MTALPRIVKVYNNIPLRTKLLLWFTPLLLFMIGATGLYAYKTASQEVVRKIYQEEANSVHDTVLHLNYIAQDAIDLSDYLYLTPEIQSLLVDSGSASPIVFNTINESINRLMVTRPFFQFLTIYSTKFAPIEYNTRGLATAIPFENYRESFGYDQLLRENNSASNWRIEIPSQDKTTVLVGDNRNKLLMTSILKNALTLRPDGAIVIGMDERDLRQNYTPQNKNVHMFIVRDDGTILSDSEGKWLGHSVRELPMLETKEGAAIDWENDVNRDEWLYAQEQSALTGWHVLIFQPQALLFDQLSSIKWVTLSLIGIAFLCCLLFSWAASTVITGPIKGILRSMRRFQHGDFSQSVSIVGTDEIGQLGTGYNNMVKQIKELIDDVFSFEVKQREADLRLLQSQINPHFLYNTLNTISWNAQKVGAPEIADMIYNLSTIFRTSLSNGKDWIPLSEEMRMVESYLFLQKMRYPDKLDYEIELAAEAALVELPKLLLQPLVENAIVHGFESAQIDKGFIQITCTVESGMLLIEVVDNGSGIPAERLDRLKQHLFHDDEDDHSGSLSKDEGYALSNIVNRLKLSYRGAASIHLHSVQHRGTKVSLQIPLKR